MGRAADALDPPNLGLDGDDRCAACDRTLGWIDASLACPSGCLYCRDCAADAAGTCPSCGEPLAGRPARARALPSR